MSLPANSDRNDEVVDRARRDEDEAIDRSRRRLLKAGLYVAPFVATFGVFIENAQATHTGCPPCGPQCQPNVRCAPHNREDCGPHGGG
jgi:hypothetical protein